MTEVERTETNPTNTTGMNTSGTGTAMPETEGNSTEITAKTRTEGEGVTDTPQSTPQSTDDAAPETGAVDVDADVDVDVDVDVDGSKDYIVPNSVKDIEDRELKISKDGLVGPIKIEGKIPNLFNVNTGSHQGYGLAVGAFLVK